MTAPRCRNCNRPLTAAQSRQRGMGPHCWRAHHPDPPPRRTAASGPGRRRAHDPRTRRPPQEGPQPMNPTSAPPAASQALLTQSLSAGNGNPAVTATPPPGAIWHGECKLWWTGSERSHCGGCHITLSSLSAFERHRKGLRCNDPASVGLVPRQKQFGTLWGWPAPDDGGHAVFHGEAVTR